MNYISHNNSSESKLTPRNVMFYNILDYNKALTQYDKKPGAQSYNTFLSTVNKQFPYAYVNQPAQSQPQGNNGQQQQQQQSSGGGAPAGPSQAELLALQAWRSAIDQANRVRSSGKATFDELLKSVAGFRDRAKTQFTDAGQQITNTAGELLGTNARSADELSGLGRAQGRALGLGDSSRFNRQQKVNSNLAATQGSVLANRGENERANQGVYDERLGQADTQESTANQYLRQINDSAAAVESAGVQNYGSALSSILDRQRQIEALNPLQAGSLQQYSPNLSSVQNSLNGLLASQAGRNITNADMGGNPSLSPYDDWRKLLPR